MKLIKTILIIILPVLTYQFIVWFINSVGEMRVLNFFVLNMSNWISIDRKFYALGLMFTLITTILVTIYHRFEKTGIKNENH